MIKKKEESKRELINQMATKRKQNEMVSIPQRPARLIRYPLSCQRRCSRKHVFFPHYVIFNTLPKKKD